jgi:hypothetical protein
MKTDEHTFKTKTGFCHILPDTIVLTRDGVIGNIANITVGNNSIYRILTLYSMFACVHFFLATISYQSEQTISFIFFTLIGLLSVYIVLRSFNHSTTPVIERVRIKDVVFKRGFKGITRSRFEVLFEDDNRKTKKRLILLPGSLSGGQQEAEKALDMMKREKLLVDE